MSDGPSSSQTPANVPQIFENTDGTHMRVFVEAGGVHNRPVLVRKLRKAGAHICTDPKNAQVILVDEATNQGKHFIRDWGRDENKVVLKHLWVEASIRAGKALNAADHWGDCMTFDDGLPIGTAADEEPFAIEKSPLPTPRETPMEAVSSSSRGRHQHASTQSRRQSMDQSVPPQNTPIREMSESSTLPNLQQQNGTSFQYGVASNSLPTNPSQFQIPFMDGLPQSQLAMQQFASGMQNMVPSFPGMQTAPNGMVAIPPQMLAALLSQQAQAYPPHENPFVTALVDSMRVHGMTGMFPPSMPSGQSVQMYNPDSMPQDIQSARNGFNANGGTAASTSHSSTPGASTDTYPAASPMLPPSISRKFSDSSLSSSPPRKRSVASKGKHREVSPGHSRHGSSSKSTSTHKPTPQAKAQPQGGIFTSEKGEEFSFYVQVELHNRKEVVPAIKKNGGKITSDLLTADYVVLQTRATDFKQLCKAAVEAGGYAVSAPFVYDCVKQGALLDPTPYLHEKPKLKNKRKRPVPEEPSPEPESPEEEPEEDQNEEDEKEKKRVRKNQLQREYVKRLKREKESSQQTPEKVKSTVKKPTKGAKATATSTASPVVKSGPRSPSPPAAHTREVIGRSGYFKYSEHERDYVPRYAKVLLERDHLISDSAIGAALYKKMPNHSLKSWRTYLGNQAGSEIDVLRKRAAIAYRKTLSQQEAREAQVDAEQQSQEASYISTAPDILRRSSTEDVAAAASMQHPAPEPPASEPPASEPPASEPPASEPSAPEPPASVPPTSEPSNTWKALEEDDLDTLARFFAFGGGDEEGQDDSEVWDRLKDYAACKTVGSWEEFWQIHNEEVHRRYQRLIATSGDGGEGSA